MKNAGTLTDSRTSADRVIELREIKRGETSEQFDPT